MTRPSTLAPRVFPEVPLPRSSTPLKREDHAWVGRKSIEKQNGIGSAIVHDWKDAFIRDVRFPAIQ